MKHILAKVAAITICFLTVGVTEMPACTSVIVSGRVTADGRPLMLKVRDQSDAKRNTTVEFFEGEIYDFLGMVGDAATPHDRIKGFVGGYNTAGFCIMSLTAHGFPLDTAKHKGGVMTYALSHCGSVEEFDEYVSGYVKTHVVISNIGVIDAKGGAAYYEFGGHTYVKYDVNDPAVAPEGWRCCTNFCWSGDIHKGGGVDRWENAVWAMESLKKNADGKYELRHNDLIDGICRSYRQKRLGIESIEDLSGHPHFFDNGFIGYRNTCATMTIEGVAPGTDPKFTVMWLQLGHPACCPAFPCILGDGDLLPPYIGQPTEYARLYADAMAIRDKYIYDEEYSTSKYFNVKNVQTLIRLSRKTESYIDGVFYPEYDKWVAGKVKDKEFYSGYRKMMPLFYDRFRSDFKDYSGLL